MDHGALGASLATNTNTLARYPLRYKCLLPLLRYVMGWKHSTTHSLTNLHCATSGYTIHIVRCLVVVLLFYHTTLHMLTWFLPDMKPA